MPFFCLSCHFCQHTCKICSFCQHAYKVCPFCLSDKLKWMLPLVFKKTQVRSLNFCSADTCAAPFLSVFATMTWFILSMCVGNSDVYYLFHYITCKSISTNKQMVYISVMLLCFLMKIAFLAQRTDIGVGGMVTTWVLGEKCVILH